MSTETPPPYEPFFDDPDYATPTENPILAAARRVEFEVCYATAKLRQKGYGVRRYRAEPVAPTTLEVTAPDGSVFEMTLDQPKDALPVLIAMEFAAPFRA